MKQETSSARKLRKEARKVYRKDFMNEARRVAGEYQKMLKPKPKYIPMKVWVWMLGFFIYIKK